MPPKSSATYTLIGGEESYRNKLNQSPMAMRRLENFIPSLTGDLEQKDASFTFSPGQTPTNMFQYKRVENDGSITRLLLYSAQITGGWGVFKLVGNATVPTQIFPGPVPALSYAPLTAEPVFVQPNNNVCYFTDGERWFGTDGTSVQLAGMDHPIDPPTFTLGGTGTGVLNVLLNRFYWVSWADMGSTASPELTQIGNSSPTSAGTGILTNDKVTITRPVAAPTRATHWLLWASETDGDAVFGALLAVIPIATTTFIDQSPFSDQSGTAMVSIRRPIRNGPMIPGSHAVLYKGRIFVCGFNRVPVVIRNPSFDVAVGGLGNEGWTLSAGAVIVTVPAFDGGNALALGSAAFATQDVHLIFKPGRYYRIEAAIKGTGATDSVTLQLNSPSTGVIASTTVNNIGTSFIRTGITLTKLLGTIPSDLQIKWLQVSGTPVVDFIRVWELVPPSNVAFSALEEVEGLRNGRGEESFPGSTSTPLDADASDVVNILSYPQEASQLIGMAPHLDNLVVFSDVSGAFLLGSSFDDFGFTDLAFGMGMAHRFAATNSRIGLFFMSYDLKVMHLPPPTSSFQVSILPEEVSLPIRDQLGGPVAKVDNTQPVWIRVLDYGSRAWLLLTHATVGGTGRVFRLYSLETKMWFKFTELTSPQPLVVYEAVAGKKTLLCADQSNGQVQVVSDLLGAYPVSTGTIPQATFRQALFDMEDPGSFKEWKDISVNATSNSPGNVQVPATTPVSGTFWIDPPDPQNPGPGITIPFDAMEQLPEMSRGFLSKLTNSYGKRILVEITAPGGTPPSQIIRVQGIEITGEPSTRYAR